MTKSICFINVNACLNERNALFDTQEHTLGDALLQPYSEIRAYAAKDGFHLGTSSVIPPNEADLLVFMDHPGAKAIEQYHALSQPKYLLVLECPLIKPENWTKDTFSLYDKVFVYDRRLVDGVHIHHYLMPYSMARTRLNEAKQESMVLMASNKVIPSVRSGYDERRAIVEFFRKNACDDFGMDLYGRGWEFYCAGSRWANRITERLGRSLPAVAKLATPIPFYRGVATEKNALLAKYKFVYCNENFSHPGYITEKLFDALWAGSVPVYSGPPDADEFVPPGVYVNPRNFADNAELVHYLSTMTDQQYSELQSNGETFLKSNEAFAFDSSTFYQTLKAQWTKDLNSAASA